MGEREVSFDGLVGPTHNYAGLSRGNLASRAHEGSVSRPRDAALQGLDKMRFLLGLGLTQGILPPQERPDFDCLRRLGFTGTDRAILDKAARTEPLLLAKVYSASAMWTANAATVAPAADTADGRLHLVPANLASTFHRSLEPPATARALRRAFPDPDRFVVHDPLPSCGGEIGDEGAANHTRLIDGDGRGLHVFVYGREAFGGGPAPERFPARQTLEASRAVARLCGLDPHRCCFIQQSPEAIDAGVFHNDVISVGHGNVLLFHERAFVDTDGAVAAIDRAMGGSLIALRVREHEVSLSDAVASYLFNSQLVTVAGGMALVAPAECEATPSTRALIDRIVADPDNPIGAVHYRDVRQSMDNGGGPACLRLRVALADDDLPRVRPTFLLDDAAIDALADWVKRHYRERLAPADLADPALLDEVRTALDELTHLLDLGPDFYRGHVTRP